MSFASKSVTVIVLSFGVLGLAGGIYKESTTLSASDSAGEDAMGICLYRQNNKKLGTFKISSSYCGSDGVVSVRTASWILTSVTNKITAEHKYSLHVLSRPSATVANADVTLNYGNLHADLAWRTDPEPHYYVGNDLVFDLPNNLVSAVAKMAAEPGGEDLVFTMSRASGDARVIRVPAESLVQVHALTQDFKEGLAVAQAAPTSLSVARLSD